MGQKRHFLEHLKILPQDKVRRLCGMIKILRPGTKKEVECPNCGALLSYDISDILEKSSHSIAETSSASWLSSKNTTYIICPQCNNEIILSATR